MTRAHDAIWRSVTWSMIVGLLAWGLVKRLAVFAGVLGMGVCLLPFTAFAVAFSTAPVEPLPDLGHGSDRFESTYAYAAARARGRAA